MCFSYSQGWLITVSPDEYLSSCVARNGETGTLQHNSKCDSKYIYGILEDSDGEFISCCPIKSKSPTRNSAGNKAQEYCKSFGSIKESDKIINGTLGNNLKKF